MISFALMWTWVCRQLPRRQEQLHGYTLQHAKFGIHACDCNSLLSDCQTEYCSGTVIMLYRLITTTSKLHASFCI